MTDGTHYISEKVSTIRTRLFCTDCNIEMKPMDYRLTSNPPLYPHRCRRCGKMVNKQELYPHVLSCKEEADD